MNVNFKQLEAFRAVVEYKNFTLASRALFLTQSTVSTHVKALEQELGMKLIDRSFRKRLLITPEGYKVYQYAREILEICDRMEQEFQEKGEQRMEIGASTIPSKYLLPKIMTDFVAHYPECRFILERGDSENVISAVKEEKIRIGFVGTKTEEEGLEFKFLCRDHLVLVTQNSEKYRRWKEEGRTGRELLREPMILRTETSGTSREIEKYFSHHGIKEEQMHIIARINDQETIKNAVKNGMGITIVSSLAVEEEEKNKELLTFELGDKKYYRSMYLVYRKGMEFSWLEQKFMMEVYQNSSIIDKNDNLN